jgi:hypothetical protein
MVALKPVVPILFILGCAQTESDSRSAAPAAHTGVDATGNLIDLLNQLPRLALPLTYSTEKPLIGSGCNPDGDLSWQIQERIPGFIPCGIVYETDRFIAVTGLVAADNTLVILRTYTPQGLAIDSLNLFPSVGDDVGVYVMNEVVLRADRTLHLTDTTWMSDRQEIIDRTNADTIVVSHRHFVVDATGYVVDR